MSKHQHQWVWLTRIEFILAKERFGFSAQNVECKVCKRRGWKHGKGPSW